MDKKDKKAYGFYMTMDIIAIFIGLAVVFVGQMYMVGNASLITKAIGFAFVVIFGVMAYNLSKQKSDIEEALKEQQKQSEEVEDESSIDESEEDASTEEEVEEDMPDKAEITNLTNTDE